MDETQLASEVMAKIERDVQEREAKIAKLEEQLPALEAEKDAAWDEYVKGGVDSPIDKVAERRYDTIWERVNGTLIAISAHKAAIERLRSEREFDRRMEIHTRLEGVKRMADKKKASKPTAREQGVPEVYLNKDTGTFRIGMDARLKSDLVNAALGIESKDALHEFSELAAVKLIKARGWESFLNRKRQIIADRERKSQERQAQKETAARERADAKAQKDAEKKEAAAAKKAANTTTNVTPDPKARTKAGSKK